MMGKGEVKMRKRIARGNRPNPNAEVRRSWIPQGWPFLRSRLFVLSLAAILAGLAHTKPALSAQFNLADLDGHNGFTIHGSEIYDHSGWVVSSAGDVNGDGVDDIITGAPVGLYLYEPDGAGKSYVVFGKRAGFPAAQELSALDGSNGFAINGVDDGDNFGVSLSAAGDVNGDGVDDVIIGAPKADPNGRSRAGKSYVVFGSQLGFPPALDLAALDGSNGFVIHGVHEYDYSGENVSAAGDVNGDGVDDVIIAAPSRDLNRENLVGKGYVVFGKQAGFPSVLELAALDGSNGFEISGFDVQYYEATPEDAASVGSHISVSAAGDVNGDGIDDVIMGAIYARYTNDERRGKSYVVFGTRAGFQASLEVSTLDGGNGFVIHGVDAQGYLGSSVSGVGDVNGDGIDDAITGARHVDYVVFGTRAGFAAVLELAALDGSNGITINGVGYSGRSVSAAGDINGDGVDDVIIGVEYMRSNGLLEAGKSYVVLGTQAGFPAALNLSTLDGRNGFVINGIDKRDYSGHSVSAAGDVNGDGIDDVIIGARPGSYYRDEPQPGESYVVFGSRPKYVDLAAIPDLNDNGKDELGALRILLGNQPQVEVNDSGTGAVINTVNVFGPNWDIKDTIAVYGGRNGQFDLAVLAVNRKNGKVLVAIYDIGSGERIKRLQFFTSPWDPIGVATLDANLDGRLDVAVLAVNKDDGRVAVKVKDILTQQRLQWIAYPKSQFYLALTAVPDLNGTGKDEMAALRELPGDKPQVTVKDGGTVALINKVDVFGPGWEIKDMSAVDGDGDGSFDLAVLAVKQATGVVVVTIRDIGTGEKIKRLKFFEPPWEPIAMAAVDANMDGRLDVAVLAVNKSNDRVAVKVKDVVSKQWLQWFRYR